MSNPRPDRRLLTNCRCCFCNARRYLWQEKHGPRRKPADILTFKELHETERFPQATPEALAKLHGAFKRGEIPWNNPSVLLCKEIMRETKPKKRR